MAKLKIPKLPEKSNTDSSTKTTFYSTLLEMVVQGHVFHLQTTSYAAHQAWGSFYDELTGLVDSLIESEQSSGQVIKNYKTIEILNISLDNGVSYLTEKLTYITANSQLFKDSDTLNIIDEIKTLIKATLYKLKILK